MKVLFQATNVSKSRSELWTWGTRQISLLSPQTLIQRHSFLIVPCLVCFRQKLCCSSLCQVEFYGWIYDMNSTQVFLFTEQVQERPVSFHRRIRGSESKLMCTVAWSQPDYSPRTLDKLSCQSLGEPS